jgi:hypothetical protein
MWSLAVIHEDARSHRVAIVPDYLVNPMSTLYAELAGRPAPVFEVLVEDGWGIMQLPSHVMSIAISKPAVTTIAGDAVDYRQHGYDVVVLAIDGLPGGGVWLDLLEAAFRDLREPLPKVVWLSLGAAADGPAETRAAVRATVAAATASKL